MRAIARPSRDIRDDSGEPTGGRRKGRSPAGAIQKIARHWQLYLVIVPPTAFLIAFHYFPMLGAQIAFRDYSPVLGMWRSPWVGMKEFTYLFASPFFWPIIRNTLSITIYYLIVGTAANIFLALALNEVKHERFKRIVQMVTYAPYFISVVVLVGIMQIILSPNTGLLGQIFTLLGSNNPPDILGQPGAFPSLYVWSGVWQETGYGAVIYLAALSNVNPELYEAAKMDGANRIQKIWHIDLPSIRPTISVLFILAMGNVLGAGGALSAAFQKAYLLQNPLNLSRSEIIATYVYKIGLLNANFSFAGAVGLFNSLVGLLLILGSNSVARRFFNEGLF